MKVALLDYEAGNVRSLTFALNRLGINPILTDKHEEILSADKVIFPGVGHAKFAMQNLQKHGLHTLIPSLIQPVLGVCVGMQLMCTSTEEENTQGLGIFEVEVKRFNIPQFKVPHMGWNKLSQVNSAIVPSEEESYAYFVHSYYAEMCADTSASTIYGVQFSASLEKDNFYACQFHPEKSSKLGANILQNFLAL